MTPKIWIQLPQDHYAHPDAPTEWWWNTGTLVSGDRVFGFEITVNGDRVERPPYPPLVFTQIMLTDVANAAHYQITAGKLLSQDPDWAESDPSKPWCVKMAAPDASGGAVSMTAPQSNPLSMSIQASFVDADTGVSIQFDLQLDQEGPPLYVWGTGREDVSDPPAPPEYNYYYSLTHLRTSGTIQIGTETFQVQGLTWMDHEYGAFPQGTAWILQDMQLDNGVHISNYAANTPPALNAPMKSNATILGTDGVSRFVDTVTTPLIPLWRSAEGKTYFLEWQIDIAGPPAASLRVTSLVADQEFKGDASVYEGAARVVGTMDGQPVSGTAWNEQRI